MLEDDIKSFVTKPENVATYFDDSSSSKYSRDDTLKFIVQILKRLEWQGVFSKDYIQQLIRFIALFETETKVTAPSFDDFVDYPKLLISVHILASESLENMKHPNKSQIESDVCRAVDVNLKRVLKNGFKLFKLEFSYWKKLTSVLQSFPRWYHLLMESYEMFLKLHGNVFIELWSEVSMFIWKCNRRANFQKSKIIIIEGIMKHKETPILYAELYKLVASQWCLYKKHESMLSATDCQDPSKKDEMLKYQKEAEHCWITCSEILQWCIDNCGYRFSKTDIRWYFLCLLGKVGFDCSKFKSNIIELMQQDSQKDPLPLIRIDFEHNKFEEGVNRIDKLMLEKGVHIDRAKELLTFLIDHVRVYRNGKEAVKLYEVLDHFSKSIGLDSNLYKIWCDLIYMVSKDDLLKKEFEDSKIEIRRWSDIFQEACEKYPGNMMLAKESVCFSINDSNSLTMWEFKTLITTVIEEGPEDMNFWKTFFIVTITNPALKHKMDEIVEINFHPKVRAFLRKLNLQYIALEQGINVARMYFDRIHGEAPISFELFREMFRLEMKRKPEDPVILDRIRKVFERGIQLIGNASIDIWLDYVQFEMTMGNKFDHVRTRAHSVLEPSLLPNFHLALQRKAF